MPTHGRYFRPKPKQLLGTPYDSTLEQRLHQGPLKTASHHDTTVYYNWPRAYTPDFIIDRGNNGVYYVECKGYFQDRDDCTKYIHVRQSLIGPVQELIFVFENPHKPMHFQKERQDGTKMTHAEWCDKHGFKWFTEDTIQSLVPQE